MREEAAMVREEAAMMREEAAIEREEAAMVRDGVWEEMVRQAWRDYINTVNRDTAACHRVDVPFGLGLSKKKEKIVIKFLSKTRLLPFFVVFV